MAKFRPSPVPSRIVRSAGAVVWRPRNVHAPVRVGQTYGPDDIEVLLVHRPRYDDWSWPKGKAEINEPLLAAGVREVEEETGVLVQMHAPLMTQRYRLGSGQTKEVHYWIGVPVRHGGVERSRIPIVPATPKEIDTTRWMTAPHARKMLTRRGDKRLLDDVVARAQTGTLVTQTLAIVRHGAAITRNQWIGTEAARPLNRTGGVQALDLVDIFSALGVTRLLSSPWTRCRASLEPYATVANLGLVTAEELTEDSTRRDPYAASEVIRRLLQRPAEPVVVCGHRPVLPAMMEPIRQISSNQMARELPSEDPFLRTAELMVSHVAYPSENNGQPQIVSIEYHRTIKRV
ncbi:MAG: NUDIX domain-containing protein [Actinomycetaceae bacterium]|nr:NUDIX domain-containing protein [Actinomycetaceae bacterium]